MPKLFDAIKRQFSTFSPTFEAGDGILYSDAIAVISLVDGKMTIQDADAKRHTIFELYDATILGEKHLRKFVKCARAALQNTTTTAKARTLKSVISIRFYAGGSIDTVRAILDDRDLSPEVKFASIVSMLDMCPTLPFEDVKAIAIRQHVFGNAKDSRSTDRQANPISSGFLDLCRFLMPDFVNETPTFHHNPLVQKKDDYRFFKLFRTVISFIRYSEEKTFDEYAKIAGNSIYEPFGIKDDSYRIVNAVVSLVSQRAIPEIHNSLYDFNSYEMRRFCKLYGNHDTDLFDFYKETIRNGESYYESTNSDWGWDDEYAINSLSPYVDYEDMYSLFQDLCGVVEYFDDIESLGNFGAPVVVYYYTCYGLEKVRELLEFVKRDADHKKFLQEDNAYSIGDGCTIVTQTDFIEARRGEYADLPIDWAMSVIVGSRSNEFTSISMAQA